MPMERDNHENLLAELLTPEIEHSRKTEILQELRADYTSVLSDFETMNTTNNKLVKDNNDLIVSNSKLFRQAGIVGDEGKGKDEDKKEYSETITIEEIEKGL